MAIVTLELDTELFDAGKWTINGAGGTRGGTLLSTSPDSDYLTSDNSAHPGSSNWHTERAGFNLLSTNQSSLETDTTGWAAVTNCTISQSATQSLDGSNSLRLSSTAGGDMTAQTITGIGGMPVTASYEYTASAYSWAGTSARSVNIAINWYDATGALLSTSTGSNTTNASDWTTRPTVTATSPATAAFAAITVEVVGTGGAAELHYWDNLQLGTGAVFTWHAGGSPIPWRARNVHREGYGSVGTSYSGVVFSKYDTDWLTTRNWYGDDLSTITTTELGWSAVQGVFTTGGSLDADAGGPYHINFGGFNISSATLTRWVWVYVEIETTTRPVTTVAAAGTVTTTSPTVINTYSDLDAWAQSGATYKIFDSTVYGGGSFDPETSTPEWSTTVVGTSLSSAAEDLDPTKTYKTYVKVAKSVNSTDEWSPWANNAAWTVTVFPPEATVIAAWASSTQSASVVVSSSVNLLRENQAEYETTVDGDWASTASANVTSSGVQFKVGAASIRVTSVGGGSMNTITPTGTSGTVVTGSRQYTASAYTYAITSARTCRVNVTWYDSAGASISTDTGGDQTNASDWTTRVTVTATSPSNAAFAQVQLEVDGTGVGEHHHFDEIQLAPGPVTDWNKGGATVIQMTLARDDDGTYSNVRDGVAVSMLDGTQQETVLDYESRRGGSVTYLAVFTVTYPSGDTTTTVTDSITATTDSLWWFKPILNASLNTKTINVLTPLNAKIEADVGVFRPLGGSASIVVSGAVQGADGDYVFHTSTDVEWTGVVQYIVEWAGTILVQDPIGRHKWIRWTNRGITETWGGNDIRREIKLSYVEVVPDVAV